MAHSIIDNATGSRLVIGEGEIVREVSRYSLWEDLPTLPLEVSVPLCVFFNRIEYSGLANYDRGMGNDFQNPSHRQH